ncbi:MAG: hypothetical protein AAFV45_16010, partial [Pseudomonadota bacterium]
MKLPATIAYIIIGGIVLAATAAKAMRYQERHAGSGNNETQRVVADFADVGWTQQTPKPRQPSDAEIYPTLHFTKSGCPTAIRVALLGHDADLSPYIQIKENGNVVFLQRGRLMTQPSPRPSVTEFVQNYLPDLGQSAFLPTSAARLP